LAIVSMAELPGTKNERKDSKALEEAFGDSIFFE
jgi:hypothetical protein